MGADMLVLRRKSVAYIIPNNVVERHEHESGVAVRFGASEKP